MSVKERINVVEAARGISHEKFDNLMKDLSSSLKDNLSLMKIPASNSHLALKVLRGELSAIAGTRSRPLTKERCHPLYSEPNHYYNGVLKKDLSATLQEYFSQNGSVSWLDLCCGDCLAQIEAFEKFRSPGKSKKETLKLHAVDVVDRGYVSLNDEYKAKIQFTQDDVGNLLSDKRHDLVTCVWGLAYLEDKLSALERWYELLNRGGQLLVNITYTDVILEPRGENDPNFTRPYLPQGLIDHVWSNRWVQLETCQKDFKHLVRQQKSKGIDISYREGVLCITKNDQDLEFDCTLKRTEDVFEVDTPKFTFMSFYNLN